MPSLLSNHDSAQLFYRDYVPATSPTPFQPVTPPSHPAGPNPVLVLTSAWPFSSKMWDHLLPSLVESHRFRCIAPDRRGYGKSEWSGSDIANATEINYDTFAHDLVQILEKALPLPSQTNLPSSKNDSESSSKFIGIGSSLGCGELLLALSHSSILRNHCAGLIFIASSLPIPLKTTAKPNGPPQEFWDNVLSGIRHDKLGWLKSGLPFIFGPDALSESELTRYERIAEESDPIGIERTVQAFLERDLTDVMTNLHDPVKKLPILILQGDKDSVNPIEEGPEVVKRCLPDTEIVIYEGGHHGVAQTHKERFLQDIVAFVEKQR